jgi:hypothetical protein
MLSQSYALTDGRASVSHEKHYQYTHNVIQRYARKDMLGLLNSNQIDVYTPHEVSVDIIRYTRVDASIFANMSLETNDVNQFINQWIRVGRTLLDPSTDSAAERGYREATRSIIQVNADRLTENQTQALFDIQKQIFQKTIEHNRSDDLKKIFEYNFSLSEVFNTSSPFQPSIFDYYTPEQFHTELRKKIESDQYIDDEKMLTVLHLIAECQRRDPQHTALYKNTVEYIINKAPADGNFFPLMISLREYNVFPAFADLIDTGLKNKQFDTRSHNKFTPLNFWKVYYGIDSLAEHGISGELTFEALDRLVPGNENHRFYSRNLALGKIPGPAITGAEGQAALSLDKQLQQWYLSTSDPNQRIQLLMFQAQVHTNRPFIPESLLTPQDRFWIQTINANTLAFPLRILYYPDSVTANDFITTITTTFKLNLDPSSGVDAEEKQAAAWAAARCAELKLVNFKRADDLYTELR